MQTQFIGQQLIELISVPSTNKVAAEQLALSQLQHGAVVFAHEQTAGRGQHGRSWLSAKDLDLTFSIALLPDRLKVSEQFVLVRLSALAVHEVVRSLQPAEVRVKWPNDVLVGRRKIAGILIKTEVIGQLVQSAIVGIGVNVNNNDLTADLNATSLRLVTGTVHDRRALLEKICQAFERRWKKWEDEGEDGSAEFSEALWSRGSWTGFELDGQPFKARPLDVDQEGRLVIELENGQVNAYGTERLRFALRG